MRRWIYALAVLLALVGLVLMLFVQSVEWGILRLARAAGVEHLELDVRSVGWGTIALANVRLGEGEPVRVDAVEAVWSRAGLAQGRLDRLRLDGLEVDGVWTPTGPSIPGLERDEPEEEPPALDQPVEPEPEADASLLPALPAREIELHDAEIVFTGPDGSLRIEADVNARGEGRIAASARGLVLRGVGEGLEAEWRLDLERDGDVLRFAAADGLRLRAERLDAAEGETPAGPATLSLETRGTLAWLDEEGQAELRLAPGDVDLVWTGAGSDDPLRLEGVTPAVIVNAAPSRGRIARLHLRAGGGSLALPAQELAAKDFDLDVRLRPGEPDAPPAGHARIARLVSRSDPPRFAPLRLDAALAPDDAAPRLVARVLPAGSDELLVSIDARGALAAGTAQVTLGPVDLGSLRRVVPVLGASLEAAAGLVQGEGTFGWSDAAFDADLRLRLENASIGYEGDTIEQIAGQLRLRGWPPATTAPQTLRAGRGVWGLPFTEGAIVFSLDAKQRLTIREAGASVAGGRLRASGVLDPAAEEQRLDVVLDGIDLGALFDLAEVEGLEVSGVVDGTLTGVLGAGGVRYEDGQLETRPGGGTIRYRPPGQPPVAYDEVDTTRVTRAALQNFRYEQLRGTLAGEAEGDLHIELRLDGANPDLYDGHPIRLDLNLNGPFLRLVRSYRAYEDPLGDPELQRQLEERRRGTGETR